MRFILDSPAWQKGYDLAMEWAHEKRNAANPFDVLSPQWFGFEAGQEDAGRLKCTNEAKPPA